MSLEDELINRIRELEAAQWQSKKAFEMLLADYRSKLKALKQMRVQDNG